MLNFLYTYLLSLYFVLNRFRELLGEFNIFEQHVFDDDTPGTEFGRQFVFYRVLNRTTAARIQSLGLRFRRQAADGRSSFGFENSLFVFGSDFNVKISTLVLVESKQTAATSGETRNRPSVLSFSREGWVSTRNRAQVCGTYAPTTTYTAVSSFTVSPSTVGMTFSCSSSCVLVVSSSRVDT